MHHEFRDQTHLKEYRGYEISVLCLNRGNAWDVEYTIFKDGEKLTPARRLSHDRCFESEEEALKEGWKWGKDFIDKLIKQAG